MATVTFDHVTKRYGDVTAVDDLDLEIRDGEFMVLVGPSGCGKTTSLRMIAGLEEISDGRLRIGEKVVNDVAPKDRDIAMVFQSYALYPHMTIRENLEFGLKIRKTPKPEIDRLVAEAAQVLGIAELLERRPKQLSGGQRQRVAVGRAIVRKPSVFLFDEPLSNLDANLRGDMRLEIRRLHEEFRNTSIYVTHDQVEAMTMADRIVVMNAGRIEQIGTPEDVYDRPNSRFVARFIGGSNVLDVKHVGGHEVALNGHRLNVGAGEFAGPGRDMSVCVKTHDIELLPGPPGPATTAHFVPSFINCDLFVEHTFFGSRSSGHAIIVQRLHSQQNSVPMVFDCPARLNPSERIALCGSIGCPSRYRGQK